MNALFCRDFMRPRGCWGYNCTKLHKSQEAVRQLLRSCRRETDLPPADQEFLQRAKAFRQRTEGICFEHKQSQCFRIVCSRGDHPFLRPLDWDQIIEFKFITGANLHYRIRNLRGFEAEVDIDIRCLKNTPFGVLRRFLRKKLKNFVGGEEPLKIIQGGQEASDYDLVGDWCGDGQSLIVEIDNSPADTIPDGVVQENVDWKCAICLENDVPQKDKVETECGHHYCNNCLQEWKCNEYHSVRDFVSRCCVCNSFSFRN